MAVGLGAAGSLGLGFEALGAVGTYVAPTKFIPIEEESLMFTQPITKRRPIQGVVVPVGSRLGPGNVEGNIKFAAYHDVLPYFLYAARTTVTKTGSDPYTYAAVGSHIAEGNYSLSFTVVRNGVVFGYTGCQVTQMDFSIEDGILMCDVSILGFDEAVQSAPTPSYASNGNEFEAGEYAIEFADTVINTADELTISINDNGTAEDRISGTSGADLIRFGERTTNVSLGRDFENRTEYDLFRSATGQKFEFIATKTGANAGSATFLIPVSVVDSYEVGLSGQGELVRATIEYTGDLDSGINSDYSLTVVTDENITVPT